MDNHCVLCAVDYSAASRTALRYAATAAAYLQAPLAVMTVIDPLLAEAMAASAHSDWLQLERADLRAFCQETLERDPELPIETEVSTGPPAEEILAAAERRQAALIVLGCHGLTGMRKVFFGSTTERVLRDTSVPVLVTPADLHPPTGVRDLAALIRHIVVPVDLTESATLLARIGARLGAAIGIPVLFVHVIEPVTLRHRWRGQLPSVQSEARSRAEAAMDLLIDDVGPHVEPVIVFGEPAEEIARVAEIRGAGLVVMGLQQRGTGRVGVIAYRILSRTDVPVLALPSVTAERLRALLPRFLALAPLSSSRPSTAAHQPPTPRSRVLP